VADVRGRRRRAQRSIRGLGQRARAERVRGSHPGPVKAANWKLVWSDEFDGTELDRAKWGIREWAAKKVNDEDQAYTARRKNLRIEDGHLVIEAHLEDYEGAKYTSGRIYSHGEGSFLYGRFEIRAKLPRGKGSWPAIWMLPEDPFKYATKCGEGEDWQGSSTCDAWPNSGEIDIMEHVGYQMGHVHGTVHNEAYYWVKWEQRKGRILQADVDDAFHVYALEWTPERIDVFVDDTLYFTYVNEKDRLAGVALRPPVLAHLERRRGRRLGPGRRRHRRLDLPPAHARRLRARLRARVDVLAEAARADPGHRPVRRPQRLRPPMTRTGRPRYMPATCEV
jgi:beta-glucanase (GH16 family)